MFDFLASHFPLAEINILNILPRSCPGRNDVIHELNITIKDMCTSDPCFSYIDVACLFIDGKGNRIPSYFGVGEEFNDYDNVHLSTKGMSRLSKHLKHAAHVSNDFVNICDY